MRSRRFDDARIAYLRQVSVMATLDALGIYWKGRIEKTEKIVR